MFRNIHISPFMSPAKQAITTSIKAFLTDNALPSCHLRPQLTIVRSTTESLSKHHYAGNELDMYFIPKYKH